MGARKGNLFGTFATAIRILGWNLIDIFSEISFVATAF